MQQKSRIDSFQLLLLLVLTRIFSVLTFTTRSGKAVHGLDDMLVLLLMFVFSLVLLIPIYFMVKYFGRQSVVVSLKQSFGTGVGNGMAILYWAFCLFTAATTSSSFEFFLTTAIYPDNSHIAILLTFLLVCVYASHKGVETLSRVGLYVFIGAMLSYLFILFALIPRVQISSFAPAFQSGLSAAKDSAFYSFGLRADTVALILLIPQVKGSIARTYVKSGFLLLLIFEALTFVTVGSVGDYLQTQLFPYYSAASVAEISFFQRLDSLHMAVWVLVSFVRVSLFLIVGAACLKEVLPLRYHKFIYWVNGALVLGLSLWFSFDVQRLYSTVSYLATVVPIALLSTVVPIVLAVAGAIKKKRGTLPCASNG